VHAPLHSTCDPAHGVQVTWPVATCVQDAFGPHPPLLLEQEGDTQAAPEQVCPGWQVLKQVPQLLGSSSRLTQAPWQRCNPGLHVSGTHIALEQVLPGAQSWPQPPQLFGSLSRLTQAPWQFCKPGLHPTGTHEPARQSLPGPHWLLTKHPEGTQAPALQVPPGQAVPSVRLAKEQVPSPLQVPACWHELGAAQV